VQERFYKRMVLNVFEVFKIYVDPTVELENERKKQHFEPVMMLLANLFLS
jgi:hypothetical protein